MFYFLYILAAAVVAWLGRDRQIGFVGFFLISLFVTPMLALLVLIITHDRRSQPSS